MLYFVIKHLFYANGQCFGKISTAYVRSNIFSSILWSIARLLWSPLISVLTDACDLKLG